MVKMLAFYVTMVKLRDFIKSTDHRPTYHRSTYHRPSNDISKTWQWKKKSILTGSITAWT